MTKELTLSDEQQKLIWMTGNLCRFFKHEVTSTSSNHIEVGAATIWFKEKQITINCERLHEEFEEDNHTTWFAVMGLCAQEGYKFVKV